MNNSDHPLSVSLVRVRNAKGAVVGAGFLVALDLVCTCAHVVATAFGLRQTPEVATGGELDLDFQLLEDAKASAYVQAWRPIAPDGSGDIAVLRLTTKLPTGLRAARLLAGLSLPGRRFEVCGFPEGNDTGVWARGELSYRRFDRSIQ